MNWKLLTTVRIERRVVPGNALRYRVVAIIVGVGASILVGLQLSGTGTDFFPQLWHASFGTAQGAEDIATLAVPLILTGIAVSIPLRLGLWNIGGEGQLFVGAWGAAGVGFLFPTWPAPLLVPAMFAGALLAGALWTLGPAVARVSLGVNEIITTLLLNFVAIDWTLYWANHWRDPASVGGVKSKLLPSSAELTTVGLGSINIPVGFLLAVGIGAAVWWVLRETTWGYEMVISGASTRTAQYAGISTKRLAIVSLLIGGAMAGLAGAIQMMSEVHRYGQALSNNTAYTGIVVAVLAGASELGVIAVAIVFAVITVSGNIFRVAGASSDVIFAMYGLTLILAAMGQGLAHVRLVRGRPHESRFPDNPSVTKSATEPGEPA